MHRDKSRIFSELPCHLFSTRYHARATMIPKLRARPGRSSHFTSRPTKLLLATCSLLPIAAFGQTRHWGSHVSTDWHLAANWSASDIPDSNTEIALLAGAFANPQITSHLTIRGLFAASNFIVSGDTGVFTIDTNTASTDLAVRVTNNSTLVLDRDVITANTPASIVGRVEVTAGSTFTFASGNTWTSNHGIAFNDTMIGDGGTFNFNGALSLGNNFFQAFNAFASSNGGTINFNPSSVTAGAASQIQNLGGRGRLNLLADFTQSKIVIGNPAFTPLFGPSETYLATNGMSMSRDVELSLANSGGGNAAVHQYGVDIPGAGTATQAGMFTLGSGGIPGDNYKIALDVKTDDTMIMTGIIRSLGGLRAGVIQTLAKTGPGTLVLSGGANNTWAEPFSIEQGTVLLDKSTAGLNAIGNVSVSLSGGELKLGKANQIADTADLTLAGGSFDTSGFSETLDQLTITLASTVDFGSGSSFLHFSQFMSGSGTLTIDGWSGNEAGGGIDRFTIGNPASITAYLPNIHFTGFFAGAKMIGNEIVPVPEPSSALLLLSAVGFGMSTRRRVRQS
jgi:autotransporter-associated beta strand protein